MRQKRRVRLTESQLHGLIRECVRGLLRENIGDVTEQFNEDLQTSKGELTDVFDANYGEEGGFEVISDVEFDNGHLYHLYIDTDDGGEIMRVSGFFYAGGDDNRPEIRSRLVKLDLANANLGEKVKDILIYNFGSED